jgi:hypothetical protein
MTGPLPADNRLLSEPDRLGAEWKHFLIYAKRNQSDL